jgi:TonB-linked SusC/RagA family outer membrane protein
MKLRTWCIRSGQILAKPVLVFAGFLVFLTIFNPATVEAENGRGGITIHHENVPIQKVFQSIEKQSGYRFFYNETLLQGAVKVTLNLQHVSLQEALDACFRNQPLSYAIVDKTIIVKRRSGQQPLAPIPPAVSFTTPAKGKLIAVRGKVTSNNIPVAGASIMIKGTDNGASTDKDGVFTLSEVDEDATLVVSSVSHQAREVKVNGQGFIAIDLDKKTSDLDEAVVVAYNTTTRRMNTGAVTVVKGEEIQNLPSRSFDRSLQGLVPGLLVTGGTGQPGAGVSNFVLRGIATAVDPSLSSARNPLIIMDGIPVTQDNFQLYINSPYTPITNPLAQLNPSDIETITVLKDAAAIALYGAKASNGVIVVTTKKGKAGKTRFNFRHQTDAAARLDRNVELLNQQEYLDLVKEEYKNYNSSLSDADILADLRKKFPVIVNSPGDTSFYAATNWPDQVFNSHAISVSNEISMSGGSDQTSFYLNLEYAKQNGIVKKTDYDRKSLRFNFENRPYRWIKLGLNSTLSYNTQDYGGSVRGVDGPVVFAMSPLNPLRSLDGNYMLNYNWGGVNTIEPNPVAAAEYNTNRNTSFRGLTKFYAELELLKWLKVTSNLGVDYMQSESREKADPRLYDPGNPVTPGTANAGRVEELNLRRSNIISTNMLRIDKVFHNEHSLNVIAGQEAQVLNQKNLSVAVSGFSLPYYDQISSPGVSVMANRQNGFVIKETLLSFFGQANYGFRSKYFLSGSIRRDGSSKFGEDKRFGTYWSTGVGWVVTSEPFMKNISRWLNYLKVRGSIGAAGNAGAIDRFTQFDKLVASGYLGRSAVYPLTSSPGNPNVKWEQTSSWDAGIEMRLLSERITFNADIYKRNTSDLIYNINLPLNAGYSSVLANIGEMENKGIELFLSSDIIRNKNLRWNLNFNWAKNKNVLKKANVPTTSTLSGVLGNKAGENFNSFYLPTWAGVNAQNGKPQWINAAGDPDTLFSNAVSTFVGKPQPDGFGAITNTISFKEIEISARLYYQYGYKIYNYDGLVNDGQNPYFNQKTLVLNHWRKPGDDAVNPRRVLNNTDGGNAQSTRYLFDGDYIRLQNVSIAYNFPKQIVNALHLSILKVYVQGNNLAVWTKFPGKDPDIVNVVGVSGLTYPSQRSFSIGVNAGF